MIGQSKNRFESASDSEPQNLSVILRRAPARANLILNKEMSSNFKLKESVSCCSEFSVDITGYYHISSQITLKNISKMLF